MGISYKTNWLPKQKVKYILKLYGTVYFSLGGKVVAFLIRYCSKMNRKFIYVLKLKAGKVKVISTILQFLQNSCKKVFNVDCIHLFTLPMPIGKKYLDCLVPLITSPSTFLHAQKCRKLVLFHTCIFSHIILSKAEVNSSSSSHFTNLGPPVNTVTCRKSIGYHMLR